MLHQLDALVLQAETDFATASTSTALEAVKAKYLGRSGVLTAQMKALSQLSVAERPQAGAHINRAKLAIEQALQARRSALLLEAQAALLAEERIDVTLPARRRNVGGLHPVTLCRRRIEQLFHSLGFAVVQGPEIEGDFYNFTALNIPENHPARAMHDTFYLASGHVLRTHTSPVQVRYMQDLMQRLGESTVAPPCKIIAPGRVYRVDSDATHSPMFHQVEGLWVNDQVSFADLQALLLQFVRHFFADLDYAIRFRPSYFPFTEPSAELDIRRNAEEGWLEIGGCGVVHPEVFKRLGVKHGRGVAFGLGIERLSMLRYGVHDLRQFFNHDLRFLAQFH